MESQKKHARVYSFEFFPPKTEQGVEKLRVTRMELAKLNPRFFSVTFGAGGSTRERTFDTVCEIQRDSGIEAAPHLSCVGSTRENIRDILNLYRSENIHHIVALRGDLPSGAGLGALGDLSNAYQLVQLVF